MSLLSSTTDFCYDGGMREKVKSQKGLDTFRKAKFKLLLTFIFLFLTLPATVHGAQFSESFLRLDRTKVSSPLLGTVCAKPSSGAAGTENKVAVTFPADFTISTIASNWTVTTTNLPSGNTAWPGIGTATSISGQTVTFPSNDLTSSTTLYCFNFSSTSSQVSSWAGQKSGTIATKTLDDSVIDINNFAVSIVNDDQIRVTASIPAHAGSVQLNILPVNTAAEVSQDTFMEFEVTYGSYLPDPIDLTLEVQGYKGFIEGSGAPSIDITDYVYGSATNAINNVPPVLDPVHRKIIWNIANFPANTKDKKVRFAIRTNSTYTGSSKVNFSAAARIIGPGFVTPDKTVTKTYKYDPSKVTSSSSTASTTSQTTTTTTTTSTSALYITPYPGYVSPTVFRNIFIPVISQNDAKIFINTFAKYFHSVQYGPSPTRLNNRVTSLNKTDKQQLDLADLTPDSTYYFKAEVKDESGKVTGTETFTFKTAEISDKPEVEKSSLLVTSQSNVISNPSASKAEDGAEQKPSIVVPRETTYEIRFALKKHQSAKKVQAIVRVRDVLGISTVYAQEPNAEVVDMIEVEPGVYAGSLKSKPEPGYYEQFIRIEDHVGNIQEEKVADIKVMQPFTVLDKSSKNPIENARVLLSIYSQETRTYQIIGPNVIPIKNPSYSDSRGEVELVLPPGKYKAEVVNLGYKEETAEFTIGLNPEDGFPTLHLEKEPFNPVNMVRYYGRTVRDVFLLNTKAYLESLAKSLRFFNLIVAVSIGSLVVLTLLSFSLRTHIPLQHLPKYFLFHMRRLLPNTSLLAHIHGTVIDPHAKSPITQADVYIIDADRKVIVDQTSTNKIGEFFFDKLPEGHYEVQVMKRGYEPSGTFEYPLPDGVPGQFTISLHQNETLEQSVRENISWAAENVIGFSFELLLIASLVFEVLFGYTFGWQKVIPFLLISLANLLLWLIFLRHLLRRNA